MLCPKDRMLESQSIETPETVASHYNDLDPFYREIWGTHVHHGLWQTGKESTRTATLQLIERLIEGTALSKESRICDIGCGYGETARYLAETHGAQVTGFTVSQAQYDYAQSLPSSPAGVSIQLQDWLKNGETGGSYDLAIAIESSEHMADLGEFLREAHRVLKPGGSLRICAWLSKESPARLERRFLLQPICTEGRLRLVTVTEYMNELEKAGFEALSFEDLTDQVKATWTHCLKETGRKLLTDPKYLSFLAKAPSRNKRFLASLIRIRVAYETRAMLYGIFRGRKR